MAILSKRPPAGTQMPVREQRTYTDASRYVWAVARIALGWIFLWAFLDKLFGWTFATPAGKGWLDSGSPTKGFLSNAASGPFEGFYKGIAGDGWANTLFMLGLLGIGVALILGIGMRIAAGSGALMMLMMWSVALPPENNPIIDDHIIYAIVLIGLAVMSAGDTWGFGRQWSNLEVVKQYPVLK